MQFVVPPNFQMSISLDIAAQEIHVTEPMTALELYSWLQDAFDSEELIRESTPMEAATETQFTMVNGWRIDDNAMINILDGDIAPCQTLTWTSHVYRASSHDYRKRP